VTFFSDQNKLYENKGKWTQIKKKKHAMKKKK